METHEQRHAAYELLVRAKYTAEEVEALGEKGHAFKNDDGHYSYPIEDLEDLRNAIHAVGRGGADHDAIRKYVIHMAGVLSATDEIPDNWNSGGSLRDESESKSRRRHTSPETRALREEMRGVREERRVAISQFEIRKVPNGSGGTDLKFEGYASITCADENDTDHTYEMEDWCGPYEEGVLRDAFSLTLAQGADVAFLVNHGGVTMARTKPGTLKLFADLVGLHVDATLNPARSDVQILEAAVSDGAIDEMSFAFRVVRQKWSWAEDNGEIDRRFLQEVNLDKGDVSPVNYGANPHTGGLVSMRSAMGALLGGRGLTYEAWVTALGEIRAGKAISQATFETLQPIHEHLASGSEMAGSLAELLGLDGAEEVEEEGSEDRSTQILILPDHTTQARAALARLGR
jgi:Escherichia/Staphylococcus phage prohead protease